MSAISTDLPKILNYQAIALIHKSDRTLVYRARNDTDGKSVVIKLMGNQYPSVGEIVRFRNQYTIIKNLAIEGIIQPYSLERYENGYALIMEDMGGISLADYKDKYSLSMVQFLDLAIQLAEILHQLHQQKVIHKDIKPANILIHAETQQIQLIDFSISTLLPKETQTLQTPNILEGTLAYLSPEQTGRMNRGIDYRSDFYSLGVTFHELLVGNVPFAYDDPLELIHAHIAQSPDPLSQWVCLEGKICPKPLSDIVLKLMAKNAEDRYQSALGLKYDLEQCRNQYSTTGEIESFKLGTRDRCDRFLIPEKLYGRDAEVQTLLDAFQRVSNPSPFPQKRAEMMLVAGFSGIGKTAVINEVHKPMTRQKGYFIKGKFDQFNRNIPFSAFVQAFRSLMSQLLAESDRALAGWKAKILAALGESAQVLIEVIPELESIIGKQPDVPELSGSAAQNRFQLLFGKFVQIFATRDHPLIIFLDDLQWADSASLNLLKLLMKESKTYYLLVLGAYRDNEVFPAHPFMLALDEIRQDIGNVNILTLAPLGDQEITDLVADALLCSPKTAAPLSKLVFQKTRGNPFFTTQFLQGLHDDRYIIFNATAGYWQCDLTQVRESALTDNVVEFMVRRLQKLSRATQEVLQMAACMGNQFDSSTLAVVCEDDRKYIALALWQALQEGLIVPDNETYKFFQGDAIAIETPEDITIQYRFLHDRVQQAAYSLIDDNLKPNTHLKLGRLLLKELPDSAIEDHIFEIINQLNLGYFIVSDRREKDELARLNLLAGQRAKLSTAYSASIDYLNLGITLVDDNWERQYDLVLSLYLELIESEYINTNFDRSKDLADIALKQVKTTLDRLKIVELQIQYFIAKNERKQAVDLGIEALSLLEIQLDRTAPNVDDIEALADLPEMTDPSQVMALRILIATVSAAVIDAPDLLIPIAFTMVNICLRSGNSNLSPYAYGFHAWMLCSFLEEIDRGYRFGKLAIQSIDKFNAKVVKCKVYQQFNVFVRPYKEPLKNMTGLVEAVQSGLEMGDIEYACYAAQDYCILQFFLGQNLMFSLEEQKKYLGLIEQKQQLFSFNFASPWLQLVSNLLVDSSDRFSAPTALSGEFFSERERIATLQENGDRISLFPIFFIQLYLNYLFSDYQQSIANGREAENVKEGSRGFIYYPAYIFYHSLALLATYSNTEIDERETVLNRVFSYQKELEFWLDNAPFTYQHKSDLVQAEICKVLGQKLEAIEYYDRAIAGARENEYLQEEALANELFAKFYLDWEREKEASVYMQEAYYCYAQWGAKAKNKHLEECYPQLLKPILQGKNNSSLLRAKSSKITDYSQSKTATVTNLSSILDFSSLFKASQILSGEIELDRLLSILIKIILENAGATKGALLLTSEQGLMIEAIAHYTNVEKELALTSLHQSIPLDDYPELPAGLINTVRRRAEIALLDGKTAQIQFTADSYLLRFSPQSLLCLPLLQRGNLIGVLYLENTLTADAFTQDRIDLLDALCTQAAISLTNAQLYQQAQQALTDLQHAQLQLVQNEKMVTLGNLVAGVAHEINNPVGFIGGNVEAAQEYLQDLLDIIALYQENTSPPEEIVAAIEDLDPEFIAEDFPKLIASMQSGCDRITNISTSLRTFSRTDTDRKTEFNLHDGLDSTLLILKYRLKANEQRPAIKIVKNYGNIPEVKCYAGPINQVFINLLANAIDALDERNENKTFAEIEKDPNCITIETHLDLEKHNICIGISDNGNGMPEEIQAKIFEQGFTTKGVGKGTGLGMAIARQIVEEKHGGTIACHSKLGEGTQFIITLPLV